MSVRVLHKDVLDTLGAEIAGGEYEAGAVLRLADLESRFDVSRTVIREAMRILESLGMVTAKRRVGLVVQPQSQWAVLDTQVINWRLAGPGRVSQLESLTMLRVALEPSAARLAAERGREHGPRLTELATQLEDLGKLGLGAGEEYLALDIQFHRLIIEAGGNELFTALSNAVQDVLAGRALLGLTPDFPAESSIREHKAVARAITVGDPAGAESSARRMLNVIWGEVTGHKPADIR